MWSYHVVVDTLVPEVFLIFFFFFFFAKERARRGLLSLSQKKFQEKPLGPGYVLEEIRVKPGFP